MFVVDWGFVGLRTVFGMDHDRVTYEPRCMVTYLQRRDAAEAVVGLHRVDRVACRFTWWMGMHPGFEFQKVNSRARSTNLTHP